VVDDNQANRVVTAQINTAALTNSHIDAYSTLCWIRRVLSHPHARRFGIIMHEGISFFSIKYRLHFTHLQS